MCEIWDDPRWQDNARMVPMSHVFQCDVELRYVWCIGQIIGKGWNKLNNQNSSESTETQRTKPWHHEHSPFGRYCGHVCIRAAEGRHTWLSYIVWKEEFADVLASACNVAKWDGCLRALAAVAGWTTWIQRTEGMWQCTGWCQCPVCCVSTHTGTSDPTFNQSIHHNTPFILVFGSN